MEKYKANPEISVDTILEYISQQEIMEYYLGVTADPKRGMFRSPLRKDKHPTCTLTWKGNRLLFRDWAMPKSLDCFGVVMKKHNVGFYKAQKIIAKDFNLIRNIRTGNIKKRDVEIDFNRSYDNSKSKIEVKIQSFTEDNIDYLKSYHLTSDICKKFNIYCPKYVWINDDIRYVQDKDNPALAYYFGLDDRGMQKWKIYFYRKEKGARFLTNTNRINGWIQIPENGENLVITKSLKDIACLDIFDTPSIAMQAESQTPYDYIIEELRNRFTNLISLYDYDKAGIRRAKVLNQRFDIPYYFIKDEQAKDFSDYIKVYGKSEAKKLNERILCSYSNR